MLLSTEVRCVLLSLTDRVLFINLCFLLKRAPLSSRDSVAEMLFEQDNEEKSIATLLLDTLVKVTKIRLSKDEEA